MERLTNTLSFSAFVLRPTNVGQGLFLCGQQPIRLPFYRTPFASISGQHYKVKPSSPLMTTEIAAKNRSCLHHLLYFRSDIPKRYSIYHNHFIRPNVPLQVLSIFPLQRWCKPNAMKLASIAEVQPTHSHLVCHLRRKRGREREHPRA